jgi:hypothetical protein
MLKWRGYIFCLMLVCFGGDTLNAQTKVVKHSLVGVLKEMHLKGKVKKECAITFFANGSKKGRLFSLNSNLFDSVGHLIERVNFQGGNGLNVDTGKCYCGNHEIEDSLFHMPPGIRDKIVYKYDSIGNMIQEIYDTPDNTVFQTNYYTYNKKNQLIEEKACSLNGNIYWVKNYRYDSNGNSQPTTKGFHNVI